MGVYEGQRERRSKKEVGKEAKILPEVSQSSQVSYTNTWNTKDTVRGRLWGRGTTLGPVQEQGTFLIQKGGNEDMHRGGKNNQCRSVCNLTVPVNILWILFCAVPTGENNSP